MYVKALELVRLWDASVEAYGTVMGLFEHNLSMMAPFKIVMGWDLRTGLAARR